MMNFGNLVSMLAMARRNPQQTTLQMLQNAYTSGRISQAQFQTLSNTISSGGNPNQIIQQLLNTGTVSQEQYENARQQAASLSGMK